MVRPALPGGWIKTKGRTMTVATSLEERIAHLARAVDDLSDVVARQAAEIDRLTRRVTMLLEREAEREADGGSLALGDERPPHW
jgi:SlyX protein